MIIYLKKEKCMALFECDECSYLREVPNSYIKKRLKCPKCKSGSGSVYDTISYINDLNNTLTKESETLKSSYNSLSKKYIKLKDDALILKAKHRELKESHISLKNSFNKLKERSLSLRDRYKKLQESNDLLQKRYLKLKDISIKLKDSYDSLKDKYNLLNKNHNSLTTHNSNLKKEFNKIKDKYVEAKNLSETTKKRFNKLNGKYSSLKQEYNKLIAKEEVKTKEPPKAKEEILEVYLDEPLGKLDIHNTDILIKSSQFSPIISWFNGRGVKSVIDPKLMDMRGFFDEVAEYIGDNFLDVEYIVNQIKFLQQRGYKTLKLNLSNMTQKEALNYIDFAKFLYKFTFIARFNYVQKGKILYITLQDIPRIKKFFNGLWMEWYVLTKLLEAFREKGEIPPIARGVNIEFSNRDKNELDIFFLLNKNIPICIECKTGEFRTELNKYFNLARKLNIAKEHFILCVFGLDKEQAIGFSAMYEITVLNEKMLVPYIKELQIFPFH